MKRVLIINPFENSLTDRGKRHFHLYKYLQNNKNVESCLLITSNFDHAHKIKRNKKEYDTNEIIIDFLPYKKHIGTRRFLGYSLWSMKLLVYLIRESKKSDCIITTSISPSISLVCTIVGYFKKLNIVLDIRDIWPDSISKNKAYFKFMLTHYHIFNWVSFSASNRLIVTNPDFLNYPYLSPFKTKTEYIPLGFDYTRLRLKEPKNQFKWKFAYVGNLNEAFDLRVFNHNTLEDIRKENTIFIGDGPLRDSYQKLFPNAYFTGLVSKEKVDEYLQETEIGLLPINSIASFPNKLNDYLYHNLKILTNPGIHTEKIFKRLIKKDQIFKNQDCFLKPISIEEASNKITSIIETF